jgi:hypothetical protein
VSVATSTLRVTTVAATAVPIIVPGTSSDVVTLVGFQQSNAVADLYIYRPLNDSLSLLGVSAGYPTTVEVEVKPGEILNIYSGAGSVTVLLFFSITPIPS